MSKQAEHLVVLIIRGLERERDLVEDLTLELNGIPQLRFRVTTRRKELAMSAGVYLMTLRFKLKGREYSRSLAAMQVPPASRARFDLDQAVTDRDAAEQERQQNKWEGPAEAAE